ncbi:50S ribosomal protein L10 [Candidatus Nomurabacteria bacterium RIFCSPLOWO2_01_FULL_42_20]|nr:MAG: 50S ribosomal protein L10 [Candidatus Nomurabacteria bacterium RIFCSPLOWO2_01_FULL_42_20]
MITKEKKGEILKALQDIVKKAKTIVFVNFHGLPVNETVSLRKILTREKVGYKVAKKTLIKRALEAGKYEGSMPPLDGEIGLAYSEASDLLAPAREVFNFGKDKSLQIVGGVFEGKFLDAAGMLGIAAIPPIKILYGQLVSLLSSPYRSLVVALNQIALSKEKS